MFIKLFKYDLSTLFKRMLLMYGFVLVALLLTYVADGIAKIGIINLEIIPFVLYGIFYISILATIFLSFAMGIDYYYKSVYKDQGYLTNTLPLSKNVIVLSKLLSNIIVYLVSIFFVIVILGLKNDMDFNFFLYFFGVGDGNYSRDLLISTVMFNVLFSYTIIYLAIIYLGISLGHSHSNRKLIISILYSGILSFIFTIFSLFVIVLYTNIDTYYLNWDDNSRYVFYYFFTSFLTTIALLILWLLTSLNMKKRLNLE